jgi:hypothetical protein
VSDLRDQLAKTLDELLLADAPDYWPDMESWADALMPLIEEEMRRQYDDVVQGEAERRGESL